MSVGARRRRRVRQVKVWVADGGGARAAERKQIRQVHRVNFLMYSLLHTTRPLYKWRCNGVKQFGKNLSIKPQTFTKHDMCQESVRTQNVEKNERMKVVIVGRCRCEKGKYLAYLQIYKHFILKYVT
jgi:hypothetical protein